MKLSPALKQLCKKIRIIFSPNILLGLIVFIGGALRFYNLNWDQGYMFHPDEINVLNGINNLQIPNRLDPKFYAYNGFPLYLDRFILQLLHHFTHNIKWVTDYALMNIVSRGVSAAFATITIIVIYAIAKKILNSKAALFAGALFAFSPGLIQYAHYNVTESLLLLLLLMMVWMSLKLFDHNSQKNWLLMALFSGLALGTKTTAISFLVIPFLTWLLLIKKTDWLEHCLMGLSFVFATIIITVISTPYSFINLKGFLESMHYEQGVSSGSFLVPYTMQFINTTPYLFQLKNLFWQTSPLIVIFGILGLLVGFYKNSSIKQLRQILPWLAFTLIYFAYVGYWHTKFIRYALPVVPLLIFGCAWLYFRLSQRSKYKLLKNCFVAILLSVSVFWSSCYLNIYIQTPSRISASDWIYANAAEKSTLLVEHWDYDIPIPRPQGSQAQFNILSVQNYDADTTEKIQTVAEQLAKGDYLILSSRRLSGSIPRAPKQYPQTSQYYNKLFSGALGYSLVHTQAVYPRLGPLIINDDTSEETFQVYDHPVIKIFYNSGHFSSDELFKILEQTATVSGYQN